MQNIDSFTSTITPLDQSGDFVSKLKIVAKPNESVMYSELLIDLLTDYICDEFGVPHSKTNSMLTVEFSRTEYISDKELQQIKDASSKAQVASMVISYLGAVFYFLNAC